MALGVQLDTRLLRQGVGAKCPTEYHSTKDSLLCGSWGESFTEPYAYCGHLPSERIF